MPVTTKLALSVGAAAMGFAGLVVAADPLPPSATYRPLPTLPFDAVKANDEAEKPRVMQDQQTVLNQRYDLSNNPIPGVMMSGGRKPVQGGVRVKLPAGVTWDMLASTSPDEIGQRGCCRPASCRCRTSSRRRAARLYPTLKSTRSGPRKPATC